MRTPNSNWLMRQTSCCSAALSTLVFLFVPTSDAQTITPNARKLNQTVPWNSTLLGLPTLGGTQYWSDIRVCGGWKIQRNAINNRFRLIDKSNVRRASGDLAQCESVLAQNLASGSIHPTKGKVVILLHGLLRSSDSMATLGKYLHQHGGYEYINLSYASSMASVDEHAQNLKKIIDGLDPEISEINFVAHSLGNIVVRRYLKGCESSTDVRFHRMVMLAPPNQGSEIARSLGRKTRLFTSVAGPSGQQLGVEWNELAPNLATPSFEFGIIIGARSDDERAKKRSVKPRSFGDLTVFQPYDFTVSIEEARLAGAQDFIVGPYYHWDVKHHPAAMKQTLHFLKHGRFDHSATSPPEGHSESK